MANGIGCWAGPNGGQGQQTQAVQNLHDNTQHTPNAERCSICTTTTHTHNLFKTRIATFPHMQAQSNLPWVISTREPQAAVSALSLSGLQRTFPVPR
jgi:hypothetical protein